MKVIVTIWIFLLTTACAVSQTDTSFKLVKVIKGDFVSFTVDNLDNIYVLNSHNQLKKLNANGDSIAVYNDIKKFGKATLVDVSNPMKVLVYYRDFGTVVALDRLLNVRNIIDLRKQKILQARTVSLSYDNKIWVYDELENKLKKIDEEGKLLLETPDFRLLLGQSPTPSKIYDENKFVYIYDSTKGVYVFDYFGALRNNIMIYRWQNFKVSGKYIYGSKADTLYRYEIERFVYDEWVMPQAIRNSAAFNFTNSRIYAIRNDAVKGEAHLFIYSIQ